MEAGFTLRMNIRWVEPETVWMLEIGGRSPIPLSGARTVFVDRSVTSALEVLSRDPGRPDYKADNWWLGHLNSERFELNPVLCGFEGSNRRTPTFEEFGAALERARSVLADGLPKAQVVSHLNLPALYAILVESADRRRTAEAFLLASAPMLVERVSKERAPRLQAEILSNAAAVGLPAKSIVVLCALSCIHERQDGGEPRIGRGILKPTRSYTAGDAHNALADLQGIEMLASSSAFGHHPSGFVTRDRALADLWCALGIAVSRNTQGRMVMRLSPAPELFPALDNAAIARLVARLE